MFAAKEEGRNRWKVFTQAPLQAERERLRITQDLRTALASGQFALHYQPIVNLRTGKVCKAEALIRWDHPVRGPIHPNDFIAVAEESGLIIDIGRWVLTEALDQLGAGRCCWARASRSRSTNHQWSSARLRAGPSPGPA